MRSIISVFLILISVSFNSSADTAISSCQKGFIFTKLVGCVAPITNPCFKSALHDIKTNTCIPVQLRFQQLAERYNTIGSLYEAAAIKQELQDLIGMDLTTPDEKKAAKNLVDLLMALFPEA